MTIGLTNKLIEWFIEQCVTAAGVAVMSYP
jgi:hypothetical protein